jgi:hypothetical protein
MSATVERPVEPIPRVALRGGEAASAFGVSQDHFTNHIAPELRWIRRGRLKLVPTDELRDWARRNAERVVEG